MTQKLISAYLETAHDIEVEFMAGYPTVVSLLDKISIAMWPSTTEPVGVRFLESILMLNSHAQFLAAIRIAASGAPASTFPVLRASVESALYAVLASQSEENRTAWLQRSTNLKRCRMIFTVEAACKVLDDLDQNLANRVREHHELGIDYGAHPNPKSILPSISFEDYESGLKGMSLTYLSSAGSTLAMRSLVACIETGVLVFFLMRHALPEARIAIEAFHVACVVDKEYVAILEGMGLTTTPGVEG